MKLLVDEKGKKYLTDGEELHTDKGVVSLKGKRHGEKAKSHLGHDFTVIDPRIVDLYEKMQRAGSLMLKKDIGPILAYTGLGDGDVVVDAGAGSGGLAIFLGNVVRPNGRVYTYEKNEEFARIAEKNIEDAGLKDIVVVKVKDIKEGMDEKADVITLDMEEAWEVIPHAKEALGVGGVIAVYNPYIEHAKRVALELKKHGFKLIKTIECIEREIEFRRQGTRPKTRMVGHTGYLTFGRKI